MSEVEKKNKISRCKKGTRRNPKTGICEPIGLQNSPNDSGLTNNLSSATPPRLQTPQNKERKNKTKKKRTSPISEEPPLSEEPPSSEEPLVSEEPPVSEESVGEVESQTEPRRETLETTKELKEFVNNTL